jgi:3-hydroxyacyl-[acyl-carrier-protein] dehydratase
LQTLADHLDAHQQAGQAAPAPGNTDFQACLDKLPHQPPFRFVSRVLDIKAGHSGQGEWQSRGDEALFQGHFPGRPVVPGVLICEALAQMSGLVASDSAGPLTQSFMLAHVDVRFRQPVLPPATILLASTLEKVMGGLYHFNVRASAAATVVAEGVLTLASTSTTGA